MIAPAVKLQQIKALRVLENLNFDLTIESFSS